MCERRRLDLCASELTGGAHTLSSCGIEGDFLGAIAQAYGDTVDLISATVDADNYFPLAVEMNCGGKGRSVTAQTGEA